MKTTNDGTPRPTAETVQDALRNMFTGLFALFALVLVLAVVGAMDHEEPRYQFGPKMARQVGGGK